MRTAHLGVFTLSLLLVLGATASADPIGSGQTILPGRAIQDITLLPNTPFNPTANPILFAGLFGDGSIRLNRDAQVGSAITISTADGLFYGSDPLLGDFVFGSIDPLTSSDFSGSITNVVQNPADPGFATGDPSSFVSGNLVFGGASFGFKFLTGPAAGLSLYTDPAVPFSFAATLDGLPPQTNALLVNNGVDVLNVLLSGAVVATTANRGIIVNGVPEPTSLALTAIALGLVGGFALRSRTKV